MMLIAKVDAIREKRQNKNLSMHQLSLNAGLSGNAVLRIESGRHKVHPLRARAVAEALECEVSELFEADTNIQKGA